ncbi:anti-sigma factor [Candidatus Gracilibacteria bacterium]|nr:anti-sigma factor [Candidatus Gracilibacteria bacterium]
MKTQSEDVEELLPAYALGALDTEDMIRVERMLAEQPLLRRELADLRDVVGQLPYSLAPVEPPARARVGLMARVAANQAGGDTAGQSGAKALASAAVPRPRNWLVPAVFALLFALVTGLSVLTFSLQSNLNTFAQTNQQLVASVDALEQSIASAEQNRRVLADELAISRSDIDELKSQLLDERTQLASLNDQIAQERQVFTFVNAPGVATRELVAADESAGRGEMYMYPGDTTAVVLFRGLSALEPGRVYQFWLADGVNQIPGATFIVDDHGIAQVVIEAPREVNAFNQVMVTVEPEGGSTSPSKNVVLEGNLGGYRLGTIGGSKAVAVRRLYL